MRTVAEKVSIYSQERQPDASVTFANASQKTISVQEIDRILCATVLLFRGFVVSYCNPPYK